VIGSAALAAIVLPILQGCEPTSIPTINEPIDEPTDPDGRFGVSVADLSVENPVKVAPGLKGSNGKGILITRINDSEYHALSMMCTHQGQTLNSTLNNGAIICPLHLSRFDLTGEVLQGPAEQPLKKYDAIYDAAKRELRIKLS
jgi:cytochrome b6-f complex iron-sulfur subunit